MTPFKPVTIPLSAGMADNQTPLDGSGIDYAENVDFSKLGEVHGRPAFNDHNAFGLRRLSTVGNGDQGALTMVARGFVPRALFRYRDGAGERAGLAFDGRTYTWETDRWTDRLFGCSAFSDRLVELAQFTSDVPLNSNASADTFCPQGTNLSTQGLSPVLGATNPAIEMLLPGLSGLGGSANVTVLPDTWHCTVTNDGAGHNLVLQTRKNSDYLITSTVLASDCIIVTGRGDAPCACAGPGGQLLISYITTGAGAAKILSVTAATGVINATVSVALVGINGTYIAWNSSVGRVTGVFTQAAVKGVKCKTFNDTTLADIAADAQLDNSALKNPAGPVVCGFGNGGSTTWVAYNTYVNGSPGGPGDPLDLVLGQYNETGLGTGTSTLALNQFRGSSSPFLSYGIAHQPLSISKRVIMGITAGSQANSGSSQHTWYCVDITDFRMLGTQDGALEYLGLVARGPWKGSAQAYGPQTAILVGPNEWRFPTVDYKAFDAIGGQMPTLGLNRVTLIAPQVAQAGEQTILSGSIPRLLSKSSSVELGFPFLGAPEIAAVAPLSAGFIAAGSYTLQACWRWADVSGQIHRSCPSLPVTLSTDGTHQTITVTALNCAVSEKTGTVIEIYMTDVNPVQSSLKFLVATVAQTAASPTTAVTLGAAALSITTGLPLYTAGGTVFVNSPIRASGGVATVGRRCWVSDGRTVFASKLMKTLNDAPAWNDEGVLQVVPPVTAGRVLCLNAMDDKLVILCERGVFYTHGEGPDDTGSGPDFLYPVKVTDLGVSNSRGTAETDKGVAFHAANTGAANDPANGGIWLFDRGGGVTQLSGPVQNRLVGPADLTFVPERQLLVCTDMAVVTTLDMRVMKWSLWTSPLGNQLISSDSVAGVVWALGQTNPGAFELTPGLDNGRTAYSMTIITDHLFADGSSGLGWSRIRSLRVLGENADHTLFMTALLDQSRLFQSRPMLITSAAGNNVTWPTDRYAPEWRLPTQKCSQIQVTLVASPATAGWVSLQMQILPRQNTAPARIRQ